MMTDPGKYPEPNEEVIAQRRQRLTTLAQSIEAGANDKAHEIMQGIEGEERLNILRWLDHHRNKLGDQVEAMTRWNEAASYCLSLIDVEALPEADRDEITGIISSLGESQWNMLQQSFSLDPVDHPMEPEVQPEPMAKEYPYNWREDKFMVALKVADVNKVETMPVFQRAKNFLQNEESPMPFRERVSSAIMIIRAVLDGQEADNALLLLDHWIFRYAEFLAAAKDVEFVEQRWAEAEEACQFATSPEASRRMRQGLDKHVFNQAQMMIDAGAEQDKRDELSTRAIAFLSKYASSPERAEAMIKELKIW